MGLSSFGLLVVTAMGQRLWSPFSRGRGLLNTRTNLRQDIATDQTPVNLQNQCISSRRRQGVGGLPPSPSNVRAGNCLRRDQNINCPQRNARARDLLPPPVNGTCQLLSQPGLGETGAGQTRVLPRQNNQNFNRQTGRLGSNFQNLGTLCRERSNTLTRTRTPRNLQQTLSNRTALFTYMAQFLDHDSFENPALDATGTCGCGRNQPEFCRRVTFPNGDPGIFNPRTGRRQSCSPMGDTQMCLDQENGGTPTQRNLVTQWVDGSNIYGSEAETLEDLIDPQSRDKLKLGSDGRGGFFLPIAPASDFRCRNSPICRCTFAGDLRSSENPGLAAVHTAYVALHNFVAEQLTIAIQSSRLNVRSARERFELTRRIVTLIWQAQVYREINPLLLGPQLNRELITNVQPSGSNTDLVTLPLGVGMFRLHSLISENFSSAGLGRTPPPFEATLSNNALFTGGLPSLVSGMVAANLGRQQLVPENMANRLNLTIFQNADLYSINCARSILSGLPGFGEYQQEVRRELPANFRRYQSRNECPGLPGGLDNADMFTGSRCEGYPPGAILSPTSAAFTARWMVNNKRSRYFFERLPRNSALRQIAETVRIQDTMCISVRNDIRRRPTRVQPNPLTVPSSSNRPVSCPQLVNNLATRLRPLLQRLVTRERPRFVRVSRR